MINYVNQFCDSPEKFHSIFHLNSYGKLGGGNVWEFSAFGIVFSGWLLALIVDCIWTLEYMHHFIFASWLQKGSMTDTEAQLRAEIKQLLKEASSFSQ